MEISVVIVNYNVRHYLEQCLTSLLSALTGFSSEVIVVDNNSADGSCSMVRDRFPSVTLISNNHNPGFATATNQGLRIAVGKYLLLLNPDTVLPVNAISAVLDFMNNTPNAGASGLRMIDGRGRFLPESKRGLPTPAAAFFRVSGIYRLFPRSSFVNRYYMGDKSSDNIQKIEVLTGAFMLIRKEVLEKVGLLDEEYFMYGEDIDLSYRITSAGFSLYYLPEPTIIHYKGESTRQSDYNYLIHFYRSMIIFVKKHMTKNRPGLFILMIKTAIVISGFLSFVFKAFKKIAAPLAGKADIRGVSNRIKKVIIVSCATEFRLITEMLLKEDGKFQIIGRVGPDYENNTEWLGKMDDITEVVRINTPDEIIFSAADIETGKIIESISRLSGYRTVKKIARTNVHSIIGGRAAQKKGEIYTLKL